MFLVEYTRDGRQRHKILPIGVQRINVIIGGTGQVGTVTTGLEERKHVQCHLGG